MLISQHTEQEGGVRGRYEMGNGDSIGQIGRQIKAWKETILVAAALPIT